MSLENDIFNNPLEAFPEFIDEAVPQTPAEPEPEQKQPEPVKKSTSVLLRSSTSYIDPLETIDEIDLSTLSDSAEELTFNEDTPVVEEDTEISFFNKSNLTIGSIEYEDVAVRRTDDYLDIDDSVPDAAPETEEVSLDDFLSDAGSGTEEIDLDAFLGDSGFSDSAAPSHSAGSATEEISLEDFGVDFGGIEAVSMGDFVPSAKQEKSDIENAPAIDMELEFDDDFVLETKANPEDDIDFDFEALMSGESIQIPQTASTGDELLDNFDDIFNNIVDETAPAAPASSDGEIEFDPSKIEEVSFDEFGLGSSDTSSSESEEKVSEQQIVFDEVSEFDDLLSSFSDDTHVEVADNRKDSYTRTGPRDYNIIVVMEDEDETVSVPQAPAVEENADEEEEDYQVSIFKNDEEADSFRNHFTVPSETSSNETSFPVNDSPVSFNAAASSFEDVSLDDFGVAFEDETPAEKPPVAEQAEEQEPVVEEETTPAFNEQEIVFEEEPVTAPDEQEPVVEEEPTPAFDEQEAVVEEMVFDEPVEEETFIEDTITEEPLEPSTECEDTAIDDKKIVELSVDCVYNGNNTEYTSSIIDDYNEEISDTMDSMNEGLLEKIVSELSVLRNEMQNLRDEVQTLKGGEPAAVETDAAPAVQEDEFVLPEEAAPEEEIPLPEADPFAAPQQEAGGFFSGDDDDETIALSGDELNNILNSADFTQEDGSNFGMEAPEGSVLPDGLDDGFNLDEPAASEEPAADDFAIDESPAAEEAVSDDFSIDEPAVEESVPTDDFMMDEPAVTEEPAFAEETATDDFSVEEPAVTEETVADEFAIEEPAAEEPAITEEAITEDVSIDDFNTDLPSLKEDETSEEIITDEEPVSEEAPSTDDFSLDDFDIPEPSVEENSIADIDIDEPEAPKAEDNFSLDEFDIPEPSVEENSIADIDIDEPAADAPAEAEDTDFYANSDSPAITEDGISAIDIQDNLEEPVLDDIDFGMDEPQSEDIEIPTGDSLVVDSSSTDFLEEDDPTLDEQLTSEKVDYLNEEASVDDLGALPEIDEPMAVEGMEDSLEADTLAVSEDETPADDVFSSQWDAPDVTEETVPVSEPDEEEFVQASTSFDDPVSFDLDEPAAEIPSEEPEFDAISDYEAPAEESEVSEEPAAEETAPVQETLDSDIKQEVKSVLKYMDQLLENLPEDKIAEFAQSEHFETYKKLFNELGLV